MTARNVAGFAALAMLAAGSWYLAGSLREPDTAAEPGNTFSGGFYLKSARIQEMGDQGNLLYEILAEYAVQKENDEIEFSNVQISYSPTQSVPWTLEADTATIGPNQQQVILEGHVRAVSSEGIAGEATEIRTSYLEFQPERFRAETDSRVRIRVGTQSLTATGMLALLQENQLHLKSNISGRFVP